MNIIQLIAEAEKELRSASDMAQSVIKTAEREGRANLTVDETRLATAYLERAETAKGKKAALVAIQNEEQTLDQQAGDTRSTGVRAPGRTASVRIGSEPLTYRSPDQTARRPDGSPAEPTFLNDLYRAQILNDPSSHERLARHGNEMRVEQSKMYERAVGSGGVPGFLPPQYLTELFAEFARAGRPTANLCRSMPLPEIGLSVNIPRVTTSSSTSVQATENTILGNQDPASTLLTANVVTIGGYVILSRQTLERGPLTEDVVVADLAADYNQKLDAQVLNGSGASGQHLGILNVSGINSVVYTATTPVLVGATTPMWPKLASAVGQVMSGRFAGPNAMVMSPTEWAWMLAATDPSTNRPIIQPNQQGGTFNAAGLQDGMPTYQRATGPLFNLPVTLDGGMPANLGAGTNETRVIVADFEDLILFEDNNGAPSQLRFEQPSGNALGVMLIAYGYSAFAGGRQPKSISVLSGTGMITPAL